MRQLALFSLLFAYSVSLNFVTICTGPYVPQLFYVASRFLLVFMLLGFILLVLPFNSRRHSIGWGYTVPILPIIGFFGFTSCPAMACFSRELIKCFMGLADRRAHASKCCFVCSVVQWRQNSIFLIILRLKFITSSVVKQVPGVGHITAHLSGTIEIPFYFKSHTKCDPRQKATHHQAYRAVF